MIFKNSSIRNTCYAICVLSYIWVYFSCADTYEEGNRHVAIKSVEARGHLVSPDSIADPETLQIDASKLKIVSEGKPKTVPVNSNVYTAEQTSIFRAGSPTVHTPGVDTFSQPEVITVTKIPIPFHSPEVTLAKDRVIKDRNPYSFSTFGKLQGLKHNMITCLMQDKAGNIWIGTTGGGVTKYDGKYFTHYTDHSGLINNTVLSLLQDSNGVMWFGTESGICMYDGIAFATITDDRGITGGEVRDILEDREGNLWFALSRGIIKYIKDTHSNASGQLMYFSTPQGLPHPDVQDLHIDSSGHIWIGMYSGGVSRFDGAAFHHITTEDGLIPPNIISITQDQTGIFWFGTMGYGIISYDGGYFRIFAGSEHVGSNNITHVSTDTKGNLWMGTSRGGLVKYDREYFTHFTDNEGLSDNFVNSFLEDNSGNFWIGTDGGGLNLFQGNAFAHYTEAEGISNNSVFSIVKDNQGDFWFGTLGGGVSHFDGKRFAHYTQNEGLSGNGVYSCIQDRNGHLWFGTNAGGVSRYDGNRFVHYTTWNGLCNNVVLSILEDRQGNIWFGTRGGGLSKLTPSSTGYGGTFTNYNTTSGLSSNIVFALLEDREGNLWMGSGRGVTRYDGTTFTHYTEEDGLCDAYVLSILEDSNGHLWFGTMGQGVIRYDGESFIHLTEKEGLSNDVVLSLGEDQAGDIWLGTRFGLSRLRYHYDETRSSDAGNGHAHLTFKNYGYEDGFLGIGCWRNAMYIDDDTVMYIGSNDRLTLHYPAHDREPPAVPVPQITSIDLYNEHIDWVALEKNKDTTLILGNSIALRDFYFKGLTAWNHLPENLSLSHHINYINFNFIGITQHQPSGVRYQYKLEGLDENWSAVTGRNSAPYGNLPHGRYTFMVKALSTSGDWSEPYMYAFSIRPPWWQTWWAYGMYSALALFLGWRLHLHQKERTLRKERENTRERDLKQAKEMEKAYNNLEAAHENLKVAQDQLVQQEKLASLGQLTAGIAHEIKNPLNFVNNFSEVSMELLDEMLREIDQGNTENIKSISEDIKSNLKKIHEHGSRADSIVKSMLMHSRGGSGQKEPTDLNTLIREYVNLTFHGMRAGKHPINVQIDFQFDETTGPVPVIVEDISRVVVNICTNAFDAMRDKLTDPSRSNGYTPKLSVRTRRDANYVRIEIADNGPGIPEAVKDKILQPFFTTKKGTEGTGLGLSITHDIVKAHGGELKVDTSEGEFTKFIIQIPV